MAHMTSENCHFIFSDILMTELLFSLSFFNSPFGYTISGLFRPHGAVSLPTLFLLLRMPVSVLYAYLDSALPTTVYGAVISFFFPYQSIFPIALLNSTFNTMPDGAVN